MNKREKYIVIITLIVALGAGIFKLIDSNILFAPQETKTQKKAEEKRAGKTKTTKEKAKAKDIQMEKTQTLSQRNKRIIRSASDKWPEDVLFKYRRKKEKQDKKELEPKFFRYTGYMQIQGDKFAMISGKPFKKDEYLQGTNWPGYKVQHIEPKHVILATPENDTISIPLRKDLPMQRRKQNGNQN